MKTKEKLTRRIIDFFKIEKIEPYKPKLHDIVLYKGKKIEFVDILVDDNEINFCLNIVIGFVGMECDIAQPRVKKYKTLLNEKGWRKYKDIIYWDDEPILKRRRNN